MRTKSEHVLERVSACQQLFVRRFAGAVGKNLLCSRERSATPRGQKTPPRTSSYTYTPCGRTMADEGVELSPEKVRQHIQPLRVSLYIAPQLYPEIRSGNYLQAF